MLGVITILHRGHVTCWGVESEAGLYIQLKHVILNELFYSSNSTFLFRSELD